MCAIVAVVCARDAVTVTVPPPLVIAADRAPFRPVTVSVPPPLTVAPRAAPFRPVAVRLPPPLTVAALRPAGLVVTVTRPPPADRHGALGALAVCDRERAAAADDGGAGRARLRGAAEDRQQRHGSVNSCQAIIAMCRRLVEFVTHMPND
jgi:hypothetical protein